MKRTLTPKPQRSARIVRTRDEWHELIQAFEACQSSDEQAEFLKKNGASRSSIFRWKRISREGSDEASLRRRRPIIDQAIEVLCQPASSREDLIEAVALFGAWLRWPTSPPHCRLGAAVLVARFLSAQKEGGSISSLSFAELGILSKYVSFDEIAGAIASKSCYLVDFYEIIDFFNKYSELYFIVDAVGVMLSLNYSSARSKISMLKMYNLVQGGFFGNQYVQSQSAFNNLWKRAGAAAPFHFVERHDSYLRWRFAPFESDYADYVDEIMSDAAVRQAYFAKSLWVIDMLRAHLGPYALNAAPFPSFPMWLKPVPIENFSIERTAEKLHDFLV